MKKAIIFFMYIFSCLNSFSQTSKIGNAKSPIFQGTGTPEGIITSPVGGIYQRWDGDTTMTIYSKGNGTGNSGWNALVPLSGRQLWTPYRTNTGSVVLSSTDFHVACNNSGNVTATLPDPTTSINRTFVISKISNNAFTVTITPFGSETIDGASSLVISNYNEAVFLQSDGTNWKTISKPLSGSGYVSTGRNINTTSPLTGGGDLSADRTLSINNAAADGATKGASTYTAADFNDNGSGLISLDYTNGQAASATLPGYLTAGTQTVGGAKTWNGSAVLAGGFTTNVTASNSNLSVSSPQNVASTTQAEYLLGSGTTNYRVGIRGSTSGTLSANASFGSVVIGREAYTTAATGTQPYGANLLVLNPSKTSGTAGITNFANIAAIGTPTGGTNNYNLLTDSGTVSLNPTQGSLLIGPGGFSAIGGGSVQSLVTKSGTAALGSTHYLMQTSGLGRWASGLRNLESGSNSGSDYYLSGLADDGTTVLGTWLNIARSNGYMSLNSNNFDARLFVNGTFKLTDGTQAAGAFLKSDANGLARWTVEYVTPDDYGAAGDGVTNDATALQSAVNSGRPVFIPSKTYLINTTVTVPEGTKITGNRNGSTLKSTANQVVLQVQGNYVTIQNIRFLGSGKASGNTTQRAISLISNRSKNLIEGCLFSQMGGAGVYINSIADYKGNLISNCVADSCNTGYYCDNQAEYNSFVNCFAYACQYGMRNFGGNNSLTDGSFSMNDTAIVMAFGTGNPGHGTITGTRINHNIGASLVARGVTIGHTITGTMFYDNKIIIDNCTGFKFVACDFSVDSITVKNSSIGCFFTNNRIRGVDPVLNFDATSQVYWEDNYNEVTTNQAPANLVVSANTTLGPGNKNLYVSTGSAITLTLPPAANCAGKEYFIKKIANNLNTITIDPNASETIDGFNTATIFPYLGYMRIISNGTGWLIVDNGSIANSIRTVTANTTLDADYSTTLVNNSGSVTISLPAAAGVAGRTYTIKKVSAASNDVIIDPNASETIDAATTKTLTLQYSSITIESNGSNWHVVSSHAAATTL